MIRKLSWWFFCLKYKLGLARYGVDFYDSGDPEFDIWA